MDIDYTRASPSRKYLKDFEKRFSLIQLVHDKTRPFFSDTVIDLIFTNNSTDLTHGTLDLNIPIWVIRKKIKVKPVISEFTGRYI